MENISSSPVLFYISIFSSTIRYWLAYEIDENETDSCKFSLYKLSFSSTFLTFLKVEIEWTKCFSWKKVLTTKKREKRYSKTFLSEKKGLISILCFALLLFSPCPKYKIIHTHEKQLNLMEKKEGKEKAFNFSCEFLIFNLSSLILNKALSGIKRCRSFRSYELNDVERVKWDSVWVEKLLSDGARYEIEIHIFEIYSKCSRSLPKKNYFCLLLLRNRANFPQFSSQTTQLFQLIWFHLQIRERIRNFSNFLSRVKKETGDTHIENRTFSQISDINEDKLYFFTMKHVI